MQHDSSTNDPSTRLNPAAVLLWRSARSVQLEIGTQRVVVDDITGAVAKALVTGGAAETSSPALDELRSSLLRRGFLWDRDLPASPPYPYLSHELTALAARRGSAAVGLLAARQERAVVVQGTGRVGPLIGALLAAAGVGRVHVLDRSPTHLAQTMPGGAAVADEGGTFSDAASAAIRRSAPQADTSPPPFGERPDLVVLAIDEPVDSECRDALHARECAHLVARVAPSGGAVGPLVLPGLTSCLACADLHRRDRDPAWPALAVQLTVPPRQPVTAEVGTAATIAAIAATQAVAFLDGEQPATLEGSLELHPPDWRVRRRSWPAHPDCHCMNNSGSPMRAQ